MDNKEMLYEISLKYNTLKMYENTIEQMKKNGVSSEESIKRIEQEKKAVENELVELLNPKNDFRESSVCGGNKFVEIQNNKAKYKKLYDSRKNFFTDIKSLDEKTFRKAETSENKKPTFAEIQDKISNSQWITYSNFIVRFPKNIINIDEWRVSHIDFELDRPNIKETFESDEKQMKFLNVSFGSSNNSEEEPKISGRVNIFVNDFADKVDDNNYNILMDSVVKLYKGSKVNDNYNIVIDVVNNAGEILYSIVLKNCEFTFAYPAGFDYLGSDLRKIGLTFEYKDVVILAPNEKLDETAN